MGLSSWLSADFAIDLGTANTLIYRKGEGIVCNEPSVVAVQCDNNGRKRVVAVGAEAKQMLGRTPESIVACKPIRAGVISDYRLTQEMLKFLMKRFVARRLVKPRVIICVPVGITEVERKAVQGAVMSAGAREVMLIEEPMAAAIGAGLPIMEPEGSMIMDIGGGTTEIAMISLKGIVYSRSLRVGGDTMDEAIVNFVRRRHNTLIGEQSAERIKISIGNVISEEESTSIEVRGRDVIHGVPKTCTVTDDEIRGALIEPIEQILELARTALEKTPPELASDIMDRGMAVTGGGSLLKNIGHLLNQELGIPVCTIEQPLHSVVLGSGAVLDRLDILKDVIVH